VSKGNGSNFIRVLLIEDDEAQASLIKRQLMRYEDDFRVEVEAVTCLADGLDRLAKQHFAAALVDLDLPETWGTQTITSVTKAAPHLPVVALTMTEDRETAIAALRKGAVDYVVKSDATTSLLVRTLRYAIERKRQQEAMARHAQELERSNHELEEFAHVVSHEIKTPLWVLGYALDMVREEFGDQFKGDLLKVMNGARDAVGQARAVIDQLLAYAKVSRRGRPVSATDATESLRQAIAALQVSIDSTQTTVMHADLPTVMANGDMIVHVFRNLIENAINYRADRPQQVTIDAVPSANQWVFRIADVGMGIDPLVMPKIFNLFERGQGGSGTGVGLAICKRIVEMHGGRIWVESQPGEGSTFFFSLPGANGASAAHQQAASPAVA